MSRPADIQQDILNNISSARQPEENEVKEKDEKITQVKTKCLNASTLAAQQLSLYEQFDNERVARILFPIIFTYVDGYQKNKSVIDQALAYNKKIFKGVTNFCDELLVVINNKERTPYDIIKRLYDINSETRLFLHQIKEKSPYSLNNKAQPELIARLHKHLDIYYQQVLEFIGEILTLIEGVTEKKHKDFWNYVTPQITNDDLLVTQVRMSEIGNKSQKLYDGNAAYLNKIEKDPSLMQMPGMNDIVLQFKNTLLSYAENMAQLSMERFMAQMASERQSRASSQDAFYRVFDGMEMIISARLEFDSQYNAIKARIAFEKEQAEKQKEQEMAQKKVQVPEQEEQLRLFLEAQKLTYEKFVKAQQDKIAQYKASVLQKRQEKELARKHIVSLMQASEEAPLKLVKAFRKKIEDCIMDEAETIDEIMKASGNIPEKAIGILLPKLGFQAQETENGVNFKLEKYSASYHKKHPSHPQAGFVDPGAISNIRRIFWELGVNKDLINVINEKTRMVSHHSNNIHQFQRYTLSQQAQPGDDKDRNNPKKKNIASKKL